MHRFFAVSRYIVLLAIFATALAALAALLYGAIATVRITIDLFATANVFMGSVDSILYGVKHASVAFIELIDLILLGTVLYIVAIGLYQLFIDADLKLPAWLQTNDLDDLKHKLLGVVIILLGVTFLCRRRAGPGGLYDRQPLDASTQNGQRRRAQRIDRGFGGYTYTEITEESRSIQRERGEQTSVISRWTLCNGGKGGLSLIKKSA
jgi:uncharacterized membrane protein YqhA